MANTYTQIGSTVTVGSGGASSIDFTSIPSTYTDLLVKLSVRDAGVYANVNFSVRVNGLSTSIYSRKYIYGNSLGASSAATSAGSSEGQMFLGYVPGSVSQTTSTFSNSEVYIPNYTSSNVKAVITDSVSEGNWDDVSMSLGASLANTTSTITSLSFLGTGSGWAEFSSVSLYGISKT